MRFVSWAKQVAAISAADAALESVEKMSVAEDMVLFAADMELALVGWWGCVKQDV